MLNDQLGAKTIISTNTSSKNNSRSLKGVTIASSLLNGSNGTRTHNHLVRERTLNHLAKLVKWLSCVVSTSECRFTLKCLRDMIRTYSQMHHTSKYSQHGSIIWRVWLNGWLFVYKLSGCGFESRCNHLNFRYCACFEEVVPWYLDNYRVHI